MNAHKFNRLLQSIRSDRQAVTEIYAEYFPKIVIHLTRRFGKLISAEDIAQETFLSLLTTKEFKPVEYPTTWLYHMADNKAIDKLRSQHKEVALTENQSVPFCLDNLILKEDVKKCFESLDRESQYILYLHIWEGYSHKEIAEIMLLSCGNVRTKVSCAYAQIKKML